LIRLALHVARADAELVLAELLELAPSGVEEIDHGPVIEYALYGCAGELPALPDLRAAAGRALLDIATTEIADDWDTRWRSFHRPITIGARLHVRPPWTEPVSAGAGLLQIIIDPGQAFGTGAHPTTRLCLEALLQLQPAGALADIGCGSGVLAIAAAKLGWTPVRALDKEHESVQATLDNAAVNGVELDAGKFDLLCDGPAPSAPTVVANLLGPLLLHVAMTGFQGCAPRVLVAGGMLEHEADQVAAAFVALGLRERARRADSGWAALTLGAPVLAHD
jgi:ribosomal protein L11 methyltransferase